MINNCSITEIPSGPCISCSEVIYEGRAMMLLPYYVEGAVAYPTVAEVHILHAASDANQIEGLDVYLNRGKRDGL